MVEFVRMLNGPDFGWHYKSDQIAAILDSFELFLFSNGQDYSCSYGPINLIPNHPNLNVNPFQFEMGFEFECSVFEPPM